MPHTSGSNTQITATTSDRGARADAFLAEQLGISRARVQRLVDSGAISIVGSVFKCAQKLRGNEEFWVHIPEPKSLTLKPKAIELDVVHEDADLVVINKPAGMVVHPGAGHEDDTLVHALLHRYPDMQVGDTHRPGLVHRIDKDTSGLLVVARHDAAFLALTHAFKARQVEKYYRAFCIGKPRRDEFDLITGHARHPSDRKKFTTLLAPPKDGEKSVRLAHSRFWILGSACGVSELDVQIMTGRTHQIRAHLADIGHPLVMDSVYGGKARTAHLKPSVVRDAANALTRHALHAQRLIFEHPTTLKRMLFEAPLPEDLSALEQAIQAEN